jgi:hypothetical protein
VLVKSPTQATAFTWSNQSEALNRVLDRFRDGRFSGVYFVVEYNMTTAQDAQRPERDEADELLRAIGLDPERYRTEGGALNLPKIRAAIKHPDEYPTERSAQPLIDLLAIIHRDGGHHTAAVGVDQSVKDACERWGQLIAEAERPAQQETAYEYLGYIDAGDVLRYGPPPANNECHVYRRTSAPPVAPKPLTDEQIIEIRDEHLPSQGEQFDCLAFARAIERAHNIDALETPNV